MDQRQKGAATVGPVAAGGGAPVGAPHHQPHSNPTLFACQGHAGGRDLVAAIKEAIDFPSLVEEVVGPLPRCPDGRAVMVRCPWHEDESPSLAVYADHAHCFGCGWHGDAIDWVMQRQGVGFRTALEELACQADIRLRPFKQGTERAMRERREYEDALALAARHFAERLWETPAAQDYANSRWLADVIRSEQVGYADGRPLPDLGHERAQRVAGALNRWSGKVGGAIVYAHRQAGRVVYLASRSIQRKAHYNPLRDDAGPRRPYLNTAYSARVEELLVVEGQACALTLAGWGVPAVALAGSALTEELVDRLARHVARGTIVYAVPDGDGRTDLEGLAEVVGPLLCIVSLPDGVGDVNGYAQGGGTAEEFHSLLGEAQTWLDWRLEQAAGAQGTARDRAIEALFPLLAELPPVTLARYKGRVVRVLEEITGRDFDRLLRAARGVESAPAPPEVLEDDYPVVSPALDFIDDLAVVTVPFLAMAGGEPVLLPFLITSDRQISSINGRRLVELGDQQVILQDPPAALGSTSRWRYTDAQSYAGGDTLDPVESYVSVERLLDKYIDFRDAGTSEVLALWVIGSYVYPLFEAYPYVALQGPKGSGKTKVLDVVAKLAFNARVVSSISPASLFRVVQATRGMLGIDEAERLSDPRNPLATDLRLLLNAGYKRGSPALRCEGEDHQVVEFEVYGPKMISSIRGVEDVLESRCIRITMLRTAGPKGNLVVSESAEDWAGVRHRLYSFALEHFAGVSGAYLRGAGAGGLNNRQAELWRPLLAIASFLDGRGATELLGLVQKYALREAARAEEASLDDERVALLLALHKLAARDGRREVTPREVVEAMAGFLDADGRLTVTAQWVGYRLREFGLPRVSRGGHRGSVYAISEAEACDLLTRYGLSGSEGDESAIEP